MSEENPEQEQGQQEVTPVAPQQAQEPAQAEAQPAQESQDTVSILGQDYTVDPDKGYRVSDSGSEPAQDDN